MLLPLAIAALVTLALVRVSLGYPRPVEKTQTLWRSEMAIVAAAAEVLLPPGGEIPPSGLEAGVPAFADRFATGVPRRIRIPMRLLFFLVEHATLMFPGPGRGGWRRFSSLDLWQREAVLEGWRTSRWFARRLVFTSLRAILTMGYLSDPAVLRVLRLAPYAIETPVTEADLLYPAVGQPPSSIRWTRADLTAPSDGTPLDVDGELHPDYAEDPR